MNVHPTAIQNAIVLEDFKIGGTVLYFHIKSGKDQQCLLMNHKKDLSNDADSALDTRLKENHPKGFTTIGIALVVLLSLPFLSNGLVHYQAKDKIYENIEEVPAKDTALVLGAAAYGSRLSDMLKDRVDTGIDLYKADKVDELIMSGAPNETEAMKNYALNQGVESGDLLEDPTGLNTLASIKNLEPEKSVIIVSQDYHLPRALFMANHYKIDALGMSASRQPYVKITTFKRREFLAIAWTVFDLWLLRD